MSNIRKLTDADVRLIRASPATVRELARVLGISHHSVWRARQGLTYKVLSTRVAA